MDEYDKAIKDYDEGIRLDPRQAYAYVNRGDAWLEKAEYDKAIRDFNEAIRLDPDFAPAYLKRGLAWLKKKDNDRATLDFDKANRLDPELSEEAWLYLEWLFHHCSKETLLACEGGEALSWWREIHENTEEPT
jgi:tetratricopeptide (TPR) repeat protein